MAQQGSQAVAPIPHQSRRAYHNDEHYPFPEDEAERRRLEQQHHLLTKLFGNRLVFPPLSLQDGDEVLDCGFGAGTWSLDLLSNTSASIQISGVDISLRMRPKDPPNRLVLSAGSVISLPSAWTSRFQLVHQRLLMGALTREQWTTALSEIYRVTKPGGWAQLLEASVTMTPVGEAMTRVQQMNMALTKQLGIFVECADYLKAMMLAAGFVDVEEQIRPSILSGDEPDAIAFRKNMANVCRGFKTPILNAGGFGVVNSEEEFDKIMDGLEEEWRIGPNQTHCWTLCVGKKPLSP